MLSVRALDQTSSDLHSAHTPRQRYYAKRIKHWRKRLFIPARWTIHLSVVCPDEMPDAQGCCSWRYLPNAQFRIILSCALSDELADWVIAHELLEALTSPYAQLYEGALESLDKAGMPFQMLDVLRGQHGDVRNEMIEWLLRILLKRERPEAWDALDDLSA